MSRVVVLGYGSIGQRHVATVRESMPGAEILVYSSQVLVGQQFGVTSSLESVRKFEPRLAIVCGAASSRLDAIEALPRNMLGIFVEKPLALDYPHGVAVKDALESRTGVVQLGYNLRFSNSLMIFKTMIDAGVLGNVLGVRAETGQHLSNWRTGRSYQDTVSARSELGGGVLRELSHELDYLTWIFGDVAWVSAWHGQRSGLEIDVEDSAHITMCFEDSEAKPGLIAQLNLDFYRRDPTRLVTAICESGTLRWDGISGTVAQWVDGDSSWNCVYSETIEDRSTYSLQWSAFLDALEAGPGIAATVNDGLKALALIDAIHSSDSEQGRRWLPNGGALLI